MIGVMYGEPWNCPVDWVAVDHEPIITLKVDMRPPLTAEEARALYLQPGAFQIIEDPTPPGWWERLKGFMLALAEGTDP